jgi:hypothetical protein
MAVKESAIESRMPDPAVALTVRSSEEGGKYNYGIPEHSVKMNEIA